MAICVHIESKIYKMKQGGGMYVCECIWLYVCT